MPGSTAEWDAIRVRLAAAAKLKVRVGIVGEQAQAEHGDTGETNVEIGLWMEFGTRHVPERSYLRSTFRDPRRLAELRALQEAGIRGIIEGTLTAEQALGRIGAWATGAIQASITQRDIPPPLAESTVEAKHSTKTLVETGQLARSISWVVV